MELCLVCVLAYFGLNSCSSKGEVTVCCCNHSVIWNISYGIWFEAISRVHEIYFICTRGGARPRIHCELKEGNGQRPWVNLTGYVLRQCFTTDYKTLKFLFIAKRHYLRGLRGRLK